MKSNPLLNLALALFIMLAIGWLLIIGRPIILPIVIALITVYVMVSASNAMQRYPVLDKLPLPLLRFSLLTVFATAILSLAAITAATVREIATEVSTYEANIDAMLDGVAARFELDKQEIWDELRKVTIDAFDLNDILLGFLGGFTNLGATIFLVVIYAAFLMSERSTFDAKIVAAFDNSEKAAKVQSVIREINLRISDYLAIKTLINLMLGVTSFVVLWVHGVDFALFWAMVIGLLNYIPYIGSYFGVFFPVVLSLAQFGSIGVTLSLTVFLTAAQMVFGNYVEPRMVGRQVNLSPMVVLVALSVWMALWGIPGAMLAVP